MKTNLTIENIAELIGEKVWAKGDLKRIYVKSVGYNTNKMKTTAYIYKKDNEVCFSAHVDCYNQGAVWCGQRAEEAKGEMIAMVEAILPENETIEDVIGNSDVMITEEGELVDLTETVKGYYTAWEEVRIAINSYGKLATRNRQFVYFLEIAKKDAPACFVELSDKAFVFATRRDNRVMLEPYASPIDYEMAVEVFEQMEIQRAIDLEIAEKAAALSDKLKAD